MQGTAQRRRGRERSPAFGLLFAAASVALLRCAIWRGRWRRAGHPRCSRGADSSSAATNKGPPPGGGQLGAAKQPGRYARAVTPPPPCGGPAAAPGGAAVASVLLPGLPAELAARVLALADRRTLAAARCVSRAWRAFLQSDDFFAARRLHGRPEPWVYIVSEEAAGGQPRLLALDATQGRVRHISALPFKPARRGGGSERLLRPRRHEFGLLAVGRELIFLGLYARGRLPGRRTGGGAWAYHVPTGRWRQLAGMAAPRSCFAYAEVGGKVYVAGGRGRTGGAPLVLAEVYDPESDTWRALPPMPLASYICTGAAVGGRFHVIGCGDHARCSAHDLLRATRLQVFDPATGAWSVAPAGVPPPKVWGPPWHDQSSPVGHDGCMFWIGCGALKLHPLDAGAHFVGYFENELCAYDGTAGAAGFLHGPPGGSLQARESCGMAVVGRELFILGGCDFGWHPGVSGSPPPRPAVDVLVHDPRRAAAAPWRTLGLEVGGPSIGRVWRCVTSSF